MGILDVQIEIATGSRWRSRNRRLERLKSPQKLNMINRLFVQKGRTPSTSNHDEYMDVELHRAAASDQDDVDGCISVMERVSKEKRLPLSDVLHQISPLGNTLLHVAASHHNEKIVRLIAYHCPSLLMKQNSDGDTALHLAASTSDTRLRSALNEKSYMFTSVVQTLLRFREDWVHPLACDEWIERVRAMPDDAKLLRVRNLRGNTALHEALINGQKWTAFSLTEEDPQVSYTVNVEGESPLYLAAKAGYKRLVRRMLSDDMEKKNERLKGKSPLQAAIMRREKDLIDIILDEEPRFINSKDREGGTPLHYAASMGYIEEVQYLISKYNASCIERDSSGLFPIHLAAIKGHVEIIQELLKHCPAPWEMLNHNGQNILHMATNAGKHEVVKYILENPALDRLINQRDYDGNISLHLATMNCDFNIVRTVASDKRVDLKIVNNKGSTALDIAE